MEQEKEKIVQLASQLLEQAVQEQDNYVQGVAQANALFASRVLAAYHESEYQLALLIRAG